MATTSTSTDAVINWAYQYTLACAKLTSAQSAASSSSPRSAGVTTAQEEFNNTMISLLPTDAQSSFQVQTMQAYMSYNTAMGAATSESARQAAQTSLYDTLSGLTLPTTTTAASGTQVQASNATANIGATASNATAAWLSAVASTANILNSASASYTESLKASLSNAGFDTSGITAPTYSEASTSAWLAGSAAAVTGGSSGEIMNAALVGYLLADRAGTAPTTTTST